MINRLLSTASKGINFGGVGGDIGLYGAADMWGGFARKLPAAEFDYRREAGNPWENGIIAACISWALRCFPEAVLVCEKRVGEDVWDPYPTHPILELFAKPNKDYDASLLWAGLMISRICDGNSYWWIGMKRQFPTELYYLPHFSVRPKWPNDGNTYISEYSYRPLGGDKVYQLPPEQVFHSRYGVNIENTRLGMSPIYSLLREVCTDNEAATAAAAIMRNKGVMGVVFTPSQLPDGYEYQALDQSQVDKMRELGQQKFSGERRGEFFVSPVPGKFETMGFDPKSMVFGDVRRLPEERISGAVGIAAIVLGLGAGLSRSTYANFEEARKASYEGFLVPLWNSVASELTQQFIPLYGQHPRDVRLRFDYSRVAALQENRVERDKRIMEAVRNQVMLRSEARRELGLEVDEARDNVFLTLPPPREIPEPGKEMDLAKEAKALRDEALKRWPL